MVEVRGPIIRIVDPRAGDRPEQTQVRTAAGVLGIFTGEEDDHGMPQHRWLEGFENGRRAQKRKDPPRTRDERQLRAFAFDGADQPRNQVSFGVAANFSRKLSTAKSKRKRVRLQAASQAIAVRSSVVAAAAKWI